MKTVVDKCYTLRIHSVSRIIYPWNTWNKSLKISFKYSNLEVYCSLTIIKVILIANKIKKWLFVYIIEIVISVIYLVNWIKTLKYFLLYDLSKYNTPYAVSKLKYILSVVSIFFWMKVMNRFRKEQFLKKRITFFMKINEIKNKKTTKTKDKNKMWL